MQTKKNLMHGRNLHIQSHPGGAITFRGWARIGRQKFSALFQKESKIQVMTPNKRMFIFAQKF